MDVSEIVDQDSFRRWLEALPQGCEAEREEARRWAVVLAHRAAMRVLPEFWAWRLEKPPGNGELTTYAVLRCSVIGGVAGQYPSLPIRQVAAAAAAAADVNAAAINAIFSASASSADAPAADAQYAAAVTAAIAAADAYSDYSYAYAALDSADAAPALRADCTAFLSGTDPYRLPLWPAENPLADKWSTIRTHPATQTPDWHFWIDWYDRALTGQPQDWDLLTKVALIDPADWDKGADHINALILRIVEQHALLLETRRLKAANELLVEQLRALERRSHNNPPELLDDLAPIRSGATIIWAALDEAERALDKPVPDKGRLRNAAETLRTATRAVAGYCLRLADQTAQGAARAAGAALVAGLGIAGLLTALNADIAAHAQNLLHFAASLLP